MEIAPGVFRSNTTTDVWEDDPEVGGKVHFLCAETGSESGMSWMPDGGGPVDFTPEHRETALVLEGSATIQIVGGPTMEVQPGDMFSLPAGTKTVWTMTPGFKEFWLIA